MKTPQELAQALGIEPATLHPAGPFVGKIPVSVVRELTDTRPRGKLILITGMTPTRHGEGKTVTAIGLADGLTAIGQRVAVCLRQPSLGPVFGIKGGATGGGRATVEPATYINLGFTGDINAVVNAHNLLVALVDNHIFHGNGLDLQRDRLIFPRTLDMEDRSLRHIVTVAGKDPRLPAAQSSFVIAAASEVMAVLALAKDYMDLKERLGKILVGFQGNGAAVRASALHAEGAMAAVLRDALEPNLVQTSGGTPAIVHAGPFGNIAHGTCSRLAIELGLATADYCVVEAGFSTELGAEKFVDIVTPILGIDVDCAVLVVSLRGLRFQGGATDEGAAHPDLAATTRGLANLEQHLSNLEALGLAAVVALNRFLGDSPEETARVRAFCEAHAAEMVESRAFEEGGAGCVDLAKAVQRLVALGRRSHPLCPPEMGPADQVRTIVTRLYGGAGISSTPEADRDLEELGRIGELTGPVCVAKTPLSLSDDPHHVGRPRGFISLVHRYTRSAGAGFTVAHLGTIETMPGLPTHPSSEHLDVAPDGRILGLS